MFVSRDVWLHAPGGGLRLGLEGMGWDVRIAGLRQNWRVLGNGGKERVVGGGKRGN